jgi:ribosome-binding protein aMBF1 (putative translation factor)
MTEVEVVDVGKATAHAFQQSSSHYGTSQYIMHFEVQHQHQNVFWDKKVHEKKGSSASWATAPPNSFGTVRRWPRKKRFEHAHEAAQAYDELTTRAEAADKDDDAEKAERKLVVKSTKAKMEMYGWSQAKLGQTIKESQPIISRWLRGKENGELDVAAKVNERIVRKVKGLCHEIWSGQLQQVMDKKGEMGDETSEGGGGDDNGKIKKSIGWAALSPTPGDVAADEMGIDGGEEKSSKKMRHGSRSWGTHGDGQNNQLMGQGATTLSGRTSTKPNSFQAGPASRSWSSYEVPPVVPALSDDDGGGTEELPGWIIERKVRSNNNKLFNKAADWFFESPCGARFRSRKRALEFFEQQTKKKSKSKSALSNFSTCEFRGVSWHKRDKI